jgi:hypothetical protein
LPPVGLPPVGSAAGGDAPREPLPWDDAVRLLREKGALDKAAKTAPEALVGRWVFIQGLGLGQITAFHKAGGRGGHEG